MHTVNSFSLVTDRIHKLQDKKKNKIKKSLWDNLRATPAGRCLTRNNPLQPLMEHSQLPEKSMQLANSIVCPFFDITHDSGAANSTEWWFQMTVRSSFTYQTSSSDNKTVQWTHISAVLWWIVMMMGTTHARHTQHWESPNIQRLLQARDETKSDITTIHPSLRSLGKRLMNLPDNRIDQEDLHVKRKWKIHLFN
jgi:hypothetical protein